MPDANADKPVQNNNHQQQTTVARNTNVKAKAHASNSINHETPKPQHSVLSIEPSAPTYLTGKLYIPYIEFLFGQQLIINYGVNFIDLQLQVVDVHCSAVNHQSVDPIVMTINTNAEHRPKYSIDGQG